MNANTNETKTQNDKPTEIRMDLYEWYALSDEERADYAQHDCACCGSPLVAPVFDQDPAYCSEDCMLRLTDAIDNYTDPVNG